MLSSITNRFAALEFGFLSRLYLLIAALALLLVLLGGSSLAAIADLQGNSERLAHTAARLQASQNFFSALQGLTQNISNALGAERAEDLEAFAADVFFDDQTGHCERASAVVATGHVPHGISNERAPG